MPHFSAGCDRQILAVTAQIRCGLLLNDSSRVGGSESSSARECAEESDAAGIWKQHHILGVALTQADVTPVGNLQTSSQTEADCAAARGLSKNRRLLWKVGGGVGLLPVTASPNTANDAREVDAVVCNRWV